jgi:hypothetical protein
MFYEKGSISTPSGPVLAKNVKVGDEVLTFDLNNKKQKKCKVLRVKKIPCQVSETGLIDLWMTDQEERLFCPAPNLKFWRLNDGWKFWYEITRGSKFIGKEISTLEVREIFNWLFDEYNGYLIDTGGQPIFCNDILVTSDTVLPEIEILS